MNDRTKTLLLTEDEVRRRIQALPIGAEPRIKWAGQDLPGEIAEGNLLTAGAIGTGKTRMHRELMRSIVPHIRPGSDRRALILDVKCDLLSELFTMDIACEVIVFNPFDKRSVAWDIAADVQSPDEAYCFAKALIPGHVGVQPFFRDAACVIVAEVINSLSRTHPGNWDLRRLIHVTANRSTLERVLAGSNCIHKYFSQPHIFAGIQSTIANATGKLEAVANFWDHAERKISLKEWVKTGDSILVLGEREPVKTLVQRINHLAFGMISTTLFTEPMSPRHSRLWFFCDDLMGAGRLDLLPAVLKTTRSQGVRCVLGFDEIESLIATYGNPETEEILSSCATVSWLGTTSTTTAEWASKRSGDTLRPAEFLHRSNYASGNVQGVHLIRGLGGVFKADIHYEVPETNVLDFDPRP